MNKKTQGFSLIELIITIAIVAILAAIGIPSYQNTVNNNKIDTTRELIRAALSYGKNTAITHNQNIVMTLDKNILTFMTNASDPSSTVNKITLDANNTVTISYQETSTPITFSSSGMLAVANTINYCYGDEQVSFKIETSGKTEESSGSCERK